VIRTRVGYAGGTTRNPTYRSLGDHTETIQIDYDPTVISYAELLDVFWSSHSPVGRPWSRQYMSIVFYHNDEQKRLALETKDREAARLMGTIFTEVVPFSEFYLAEAYHQKYRLQQVSALMKDFRAIYPDDGDFVSSTAAARINGYVAGYGTVERFQEEWDSFELSSKGKEKLLSIMERFHPGEVIEQCPIN
jgi:peptide-methionine (S)-S-oxide reductase